MQKNKDSGNPTKSFTESAANQRPWGKTQETGSIWPALGNFIANTTPNWVHLQITVLIALLLQEDVLLLFFVVVCLFVCFCWSKLINIWKIWNAQRMKLRLFIKATLSNIQSKTSFYHLELDILLITPVPKSGIQRKCHQQMFANSRPSEAPGRRCSECQCVFTELSGDGTKGDILRYLRYLPGVSVVKNLPAVQETWIWSLGWEDPLGKGMATHSTILAWS